MERNGLPICYAACRSVTLALWVWLPCVWGCVQEECDSQVPKVLSLLQEERSLDSKVRVHLPSPMCVDSAHVQVNTVSMALKSRAAVGAIR